MLKLWEFKSPDGRECLLKSILEQCLALSRHTVKKLTKVGKENHILVFTSPVSLFPPPLLSQPSHVCEYTIKQWTRDEEGLCCYS